jgi:signal transduction histidine kinase
VADRARELALADVAWVVAGPDDAHLALRVVSGTTADPERMAALDLTESVARRVAVSGVASSVEDLTDEANAVNVATLLGWEPLGPAIYVPLRNAQGVEGVIALAWRRGTDLAAVSIDPTLPALFAEQAALALHVAQSRQDEQRLALLEDRDRIARDLHDLVIQRLFAVGLGLQGLARRPDPEGMGERLGHAVEDLDTTIRDIRRTIFALGAMDTVTDVRVAVAEVADRAARTLKFRPELRFEGPLQSRVGDDLAPELLAVLTEALSNVARHAHATTCEVAISVAHGVLLCVTDDGGGMPSDVAESGLANMRRRAERRGGHVTITSTPGGGTSLVWWVPGS